MNTMTKEQAVRKWVQEFNAIPTGVVAKLMQFSDYTDIIEITPYDEDNDDIYREILPMWGWMWQITDICDVEWLEKNFETVAKCGFRIYESEDFDYLIGIDGCGYDFYEAHWIPLYEARGLKWHVD